MTLQACEWAGLREESGRKQAICSNQDESSASLSACTLICVVCFGSLLSNINFYIKIRLFGSFLWSFYDRVKFKIEQTILLHS